MCEIYSACRDALFSRQDLRGDIFRSASCPGRRGRRRTFCHMQRHARTGYWILQLVCLLLLLLLGHLFLCACGGRFACFSGHLFLCTRCFRLTGLFLCTCGSRSLRLSRRFLLGGQFGVGIAQPAPALCFSAATFPSHIDPVMDAGESPHIFRQQSQSHLQAARVHRPLRHNYFLAVSTFLVLGSLIETSQAFRNCGIFTERRFRLRRRRAQCLPDPASRLSFSFLVIPLTHQKREWLRTKPFA